MGRIIGYQYDDNVQDGDAWIGSEDGGGKTKQYTAEAVANYLNIQGKISIVGQMTYKYGITPLSGPGTFAVFGGGTDPVAFSAITKLTLSNTDVSKQRVVEFLNLLVGSDILISKQGAISTFGYYSIDNYAVNATDPAYYDLGVTFKSGNGSMEAEQIYETQNFTLAAEENISTLQTTIDAGNTYASGSGLWQWDTDQISQVNPDEEWGLVLSSEEGVIFTNGVGSSAGRSHLQATNLRIGNLTYTGRVLATNLTANRDFQLPNNSGTLAITTDITASPWDTVTGGINYANGNVGIGTTTPSTKLDVNGDALINGLTVGQGAGTSINGNTVFGKTALDSITTGFRNAAIGNEALLDNTVGNYNIALGYQALKNNISGNNNVAIGWQALQRAEAVNGNTAVGFLALGLVGGTGSGSTSDTGKNNTAIGYGAGYNRVGGTNGNSIDSVFIGSLTKSNGVNSENEIVIGTGAESAGSNTVVLGNDDIVSTRLKGDVIVANGNVGIGTTSPSYKLEVDGTFESTGWSYLATNGPTSIVQMGGVSSTVTQLNLLSSAAGGSYISCTNSLGINVNNTSGIKILSNGNVGIGTTSPSTTLDVAGSITTSGTLIGPSLFEIIAQYSNRGRITLSSSTSTGANQIALLTSGVLRMVVNKEGNVGIGTTAPGAKLDVNGDIMISGGYNTSQSPSLNAMIYKNTSGTGDFLRSGDLILEPRAGSSLIVTNNGTNQFIVNNAGNVGIGTTNPLYNLDIADTDATINLAKTDGDQYLRLVGGSGTNSDVIAQRTLTLQALSGNVLLQPTGNVGIGTTSPSDKLQVNQGSDGFRGITIEGTSPALYLKDTQATNAYHIGANGNYLYFLEDSNQSGVYNNIMAFWDPSNNFIFQTGNVGIGTTSPSEKLEVEGQVLSDGYRLAAMQTAPATRNSTGTLGEIVIDGNHIYVCYATDSWSRVALDTSW